VIILFSFEKPPQCGSLRKKAVFWDLFDIWNFNQLKNFQQSKSILGIIKA